MSDAEPRPYTSDEKRRRVGAILAASSGNLVEWFDFYAYAFCSLYFAPSFFPKADPTAQLMNTAGVFAAGFLMRPIGGWLFGRIADRYGRKQALLVSVGMMCGGSFGIACLPTYATVGSLAPLLLLLARLVQGLSVGGEYGATATYMSEIGLRGRRGFFSSFQYVTLIGGQLLAVLVIVVLELTLSGADLRSWGWRIPFAIGAAAAVVALLLRRTLEESQTLQARSSLAAGSLTTLFRSHRAAFFTVLGYTAGGSLAFYTFTTYMQKHLVHSVGLSTTSASAVMTIALLVFMLMQPLFGLLSDGIGRRRSMMLFGALGTLLTVPLFTALAHTHSTTLACLLVISALTIVSLYTSVAGIVKAEMFPAEVRALGVGLSYAIGNALFGGSAEYVALALKKAGYEAAFSWYVTGMIALAFLVSLRLPRHASYLRTEA